MRQAYGAQQYHKFGVQIYAATSSITLICFPISLPWIFMGRLLVLLGQDPEISCEAETFIVCLIQALFAYATLQPTVQYFQTQSLVMPMLMSSCLVLAFHVLLCWLMVFRLGLGAFGGALWRSAYRTGRTWSCLGFIWSAPRRVQRPECHSRWWRWRYSEGLENLTTYSATSRGSLNTWPEWLLYHVSLWYWTAYTAYFQVSSPSPTGSTYTLSVPSNYSSRLSEN